MFTSIHKVRNEIELISIHIPKTAGTSFRNMLKEIYGRDSVVRFDIPEKNRLVYIENKEFTQKILSPKIKVIHGHFNYKDLIEKLEIKKEIPVITWLRDPVERVISNYYYLSKRLKEELDEEGKGLNILVKMQKSLIEYAHLELNRNRMSKFLEGILLEEMKFVGIQEYFNEDLDCFAKLFDLKDIEPLVQNLTENKNVVSSELKQKIAELNAIDMNIYKKALELREIRLIKNS